ncbi:MAG: ATPase [Firmicutes bacterium]|nr:ATPase [Bacillota bacterium]
MKKITIEELEKLDSDKITIIDIRKAEDFKRGTYKKALNISDDDLAEVPKGKPVYVLCYTGNNSIYSVEKLTEMGYDAYNIEGGWRSYLRINLERMIESEEAEKRTKEIERSIIKKFRKDIWCRFTKAVNTYDLIAPNDKIAVCISGGKDSMLLAKLMQEIKKHGKFPFELVFLCMDPGYNKDNWQIIQKNAKILGIPLTVFKSDIFDTVANIDKNPCYLCARMRRGHLYSQAKALGCNKIALGHHFDDMIETVLMGMLYSGKIETMLPRLKSRNFEGMELIRPLYMVKEESIKVWRDYNKLHFIQCACRFTENCATCGGGRGSKRDDMKELIGKFRMESPLIEENIFQSVHNINLDTVIGWHKGNEKHDFLENFE